MAPKDIRLLRQPPTPNQLGVQDAERRGHVVAVPRDPHRRRDGEEDPRSGQEHKENEEVGRNSGTNFAMVEESHVKKSLFYKYYCTNKCVIRVHI